MKVVIFLGPTLPVTEARKILDAIYLPPARQADLLSAAVQLRPDVIGLIDGVFLHSLSVWHKEILFALSQGIRVYGSSSMGALRAAETDVFGMVGVGQIYRDYVTGALLDDDEVALAHGSAEQNYVQASVPMVNVRATLDAAEHGGVITGTQRAQLIAVAKAIYFAQRTFAAILSEAEQIGFPKLTIPTLSDFIALHYVDVKRRDAIELLTTIKSLPADSSPPVPQFEFARNSSFITLFDRDRRVSRKGVEVPLDAIANYVTIHDPHFEETNFNAFNRAIALEFAYLLGVKVSEEDVEAEHVRFLKRRNLTDANRLSAWLQQNDLGADELRDLVKQLALCRRVHRWYVIATWVNRTTSLVLDELRLTGHYPEWADRAATQERLAQMPDAVRSLAATEGSSLDDLAAEHREWTDWDPSVDPVTWAEEAGFHTKGNLKMELARARAARVALMALLWKEGEGQPPGEPTAYHAGGDKEAI
jgi:hypothetical protein